MERALSGSMTRAEAPSSTLGFVYEFVVPSTAPSSQRGQMLACAKLSSPSERILCAYVDRGERSRPLRHLRPTDGHHYRPRSGNARVSACTYFPTPFQAICSRGVVSAGGPRRNWLTEWRARTSTTYTKPPTNRCARSGCAERFTKSNRSMFDVEGDFDLNFRTGSTRRCLSP